MESKVQSLLLLVLVLVVWGTPATAKPLKIGVPGNSAFPKYVEVRCNQTSNKCFKGFSIELFRLILKRLPYKIPYVFIPYNGSYDSLIEKVYLKSFDAVVGDTSIVAYRTQHVDFSRHYTEVGARMVVCEEAEAGKAWIFVKPFTGTMWAVTGAIFLYNGLMVWLIEKASNEDLQGSPFWSQIGSLIWLTFTTLFPVHEKKLRSNLSRATMVVWLFVALVLTQSYTANLTSMLTVRRLRPSVFDLESLKKSSSAMVGCDNGSFMVKYLVNVLGVDKSRIRTYSSGEDYAQDLRSGKIKAAFMELAAIKIFLDENKKGFVVTGRTFEIGGYGFAFSKGSPLAGMVSDEILRLRESGKLHELEEQLVSSSSNSPSSEADSKDNYSLSPDSFWGLFLVTGGTSTLAFLIFHVSRFHDSWCWKKKQPDQRSCTVFIAASAKEVPPPRMFEGKAGHNPDGRTCVSIAASAKEAPPPPPPPPPRMFEGKAGHDPDGWHNATQPQDFRRSSTF